MKKPLFKKIMTLLLAVVISFSGISFKAVEAESSSTWEKVDSIAAAAESGKPVAITMTTSDGMIYALPTAVTASSGPSAVVAGKNGSGDLEITGDETAYGWTITSKDGAYVIVSDAGNYLYLTNTNNGVKVGTQPAEGHLWSINNAYLTATASGSTRYMGVYTGTPNWRCYTSINDNIKNQTLEFWTIKESSGPEPVIAQLNKLTEAPENGSQVAIYYPNESLALTSGTSGSKLTGVSAAVEDGKLNLTSDMAYLTVTLDSNGYYTFKNKEGKYLTSGATGNSLGFADVEGDYSLWTLRKQDDDTWFIVSVNAKYNGNEQYVEYWSGFTTYGFQETNVSRYKFELYGETEEPTVPEKYTISVSPAEHGVVTVDKNEVEDGQQVVITVKPEEGYELDKLLVNGTETAVTNNTATVTVHSNLMISATFKESEEPVPTPTGTVYEQISDLAALKDGDQIVIVNLANSKALSRIYGGNYNNGEDVTITDGKVYGPADTVVWTLGITDDVYTFSTADGKKLAMGTGYTSMPLDEVNDTWTIKAAPTIENAWYIANIGRSGYTIEWYAAKNYWSAYNNTSNEALFAHGIFKAAPAKEGLVTDLSDLEDGDTVVIVNDANAKALSQVYGGNYNNGEDVTVVDDKVTNVTDTMIWTVGVINDVYTFSTADGKKLAMGTGYTSMPLDEVNDTWTIKAAPTIENAWYIANIGRSGYTIEWYAAKNYWSAYNNTSNEALFAQKFYHVARQSDPTPVTGDSYGLASTIADGDEVIIYNAGNGLGLSNSVASNRLSGVALSPQDGVITTDNSNVVWTVAENGDGTYSFVQGDKRLGFVVSGNYRNMTVTDPEYDKWHVLEAKKEDLSVAIYADGLTYQTNGRYYLEFYNNGFTIYGQNSEPAGPEYRMQFYKKGAEPETPVEDMGDLIPDLSKLEDGMNVAIYSPGHKTAISSKPNGDWYLKANSATVNDGKVVNFTEDFIWTVKKNANGTYSFYAYGDDNRSITVWPSGNYAELSLNVAQYPDNTWTLTPAATANCFYMNSPTVSGERGPAYVEAYIRNETEVFSGYFTNTGSSNFKESEFALQFYLLNPEDAIAAYDGGEWDGVLNKGEAYVFYNLAAEKSVGLYKEANYAMDAIDTTIENGIAYPGNGTYVFKVDTMGRYYSFEIDGKYLATNNDEELLFVEKDEDGKLPETAKWYLVHKQQDGLDGYIIYNKDASYNGTPVCIEYYSSVFSGWTFSTKNDLNIYLFNFYKPAEDTKIIHDVVQDPTVIFDCADSRHPEEDYKGSFSLDDLAEGISDITISFVVNGTAVEVSDYEVSADGKAYNFSIPAADLDALIENDEPFDIVVNVLNSYGINYSGTKTVETIDKPFFTDLTPAPNSQTKEDKRPVISARIGNVGEDPSIEMFVNEKEVDATFENGVLSYTPEEDLDGRITVRIAVVREDGVDAEMTWNFTAGISDYQLYFGQLHSHTTYSDGSGSLDTALEYIESLPNSANVQFVAFTDHSNYFDTTSAANPADAMNDKSLMTSASRALWDEYKGKVAEFNETHSDLIAIAGYEMTWSGGPGHINSFDTDGLVSRNNAELNNKNGDAGMKLYYETMNKGNSLNQFNHPGNTFGNFTDFSYRDDPTDAHIFLVEVGNGEGQIGEGGYYPSYEEYIKALDKGWHLAPTNNQDNHKGRWGNANDARDVILTNDFSEQGIYDAIRALRVYATEDKNLQIIYTVNDEPMGTVFTDENTPEKLNLSVSLYDPDSSDSVEKVEVVANGGVTAYTWNDAEQLKSGTLEAELDPEYSYYFIRVSQKDGDLAVTAPVWVGHAVKLGISSFEAEAEKVYKDEDANMTTVLYNNEDTEAVVKSLVYTINGSEVIGTDTNTYTIPANGSVNVDFVHRFDTAKLTTVTVTAVIEFEGKEHTFKANLELDILDKETEYTVTPISDVREASDPNDTGYRFVIEGTVTSNASGYDKDTAFFDCIYVEDESGGICVFPVSGEYKVGDKVHIVGHTDFYQGEPELQVESIEKIGDGEEPEPTQISSEELNDRSAEGKLVTIKGTVVSYEYENGMIQTIMVDDGTGELARVFIDGYINAYEEDEVKRIREGAQIEVIGLASYDNTFNAPEGPFPRIRIRSREDIICEPYKIIEGDNETWMKGSNEDQLIVSDAPFDRFTETGYAETGVFIVINGEKIKIDPSDYQASEGSTEILLKAAYLEQLADGRYQIEIRSRDGSATGNLTIKSETKPDEKPDHKPYQIPKTGIN